MTTNHQTWLNLAARRSSEYRRTVETSDEARARRDEAIWQAFEAGYSLRQIALEVGLSHQAILNVVRPRKEAAKQAAKK